MLRGASSMKLLQRVDCRAANQPVPAGDAGEGGAPGDVQLGLDARAVPLDRAHAQMNPLGDLAIGVPEREQDEDLALAGAGLVRRARASVSGSASAIGTRNGPPSSETMQLSPTIAAIRPAHAWASGSAG